MVRPQSCVSALGMPNCAVKYATGRENTQTWCRVLHGEVCGDLCDLAEYERSYLQATEALCVNGCKSLADALLAAGSAASKTSEDKRLWNRTQYGQATPFSQRNAQFQWVGGATMPDGPHHQV